MTPLFFKYISESFFRYKFTLAIITLLFKVDIWISFQIHLWSHLSWSLCFLNVYLNIWSFIVCDYTPKKKSVRRDLGLHWCIKRDPSKWCVKKWRVLATWLLFICGHSPHYFLHTDFLENGKNHFSKHMALILQHSLSYLKNRTFGRSVIIICDIWNSLFS